MLQFNYVGKASSYHHSLRFIGIKIGAGRNFSYWCLMSVNSFSWHYMETAQKEMARLGHDIFSIIKNLNFLRTKIHIFQCKLLMVLQRRFLFSLFLARLSPLAELSKTVFCQNLSNLFRLCLLCFSLIFFFTLDFSLFSTILHGRLYLPFVFYLIMVISFCGLSLSNIYFCLNSIKDIWPSIEYARPFFQLK